MQRSAIHSGFSILSQKNGPDHTTHQPVRGHAERSFHIDFICILASAPQEIRDGTLEGQGRGGNPLPGC
jgi:hypothetical protein